MKKLAVHTIVVMALQMLAHTTVFVFFSCWVLKHTLQNNAITYFTYLGYISIWPYPVTCVVWICKRDSITSNFKACSWLWWLQVRLYMLEPWHIRQMWNSFPYFSWLNESYELWAHGKETPWFYFYLESIYRIGRYQ